MNEALEDDFCDILTKAMRGNGVDVAHLASRLQCSESDVGSWASGQTLPAPSVIEQIAEALGLDAGCLCAGAEKRWSPATPMPKDVQRYQQAPHVSNGYILHHRGELAVFDPAGNPETIRKLIKQMGGNLRYLFITHRHADHCDAAVALHTDYPQARIIMHPIELATVEALHGIAVPLHQGEQFPFGSSAVKAYVLPGHTDGLTCFHFNSYFFPGDAIFAGSIGRNFGPHTSYREQIRHLKNLIMTKLDAATILFPGHGPISTVANEREHNPFLAGAASL